LVRAAACRVACDRAGEGAVLQRRGLPHELARVPRLRRGSGARDADAPFPRALRPDARFRRRAARARDVTRVSAAHPAAAEPLRELLRELPRRFRCRTAMTRVAADARHASGTECESSHVLPVLPAGACVLLP